MLPAIRNALTFLQENRVLNRLGAVLSVVIIAVAVYVLYENIKDIDVDDLVAALRETDVSMVALAALFVAAGYFTLTFYDLFALRTIGRTDIPYRVAALAGFTSYSIGHNIGASAFSGGAVRYRIYSSCGLDAVEVAKVCFVAGLTFWRTGDWRRSDAGKETQGKLHDHELRLGKLESKIADLPTKADIARLTAEVDAVQDTVKLVREGVTRIEDWLLERSK